MAKNNISDANQFQEDSFEQLNKQPAPKNPCINSKTAPSQALNLKIHPE